MLGHQTKPETASEHLFRALIEDLVGAVAFPQVNIGVAQVLTRHIPAPSGDTTPRRITVMKLALAAIRLSPDDFIFRKLTGTEPLFPSLKSHRLPARQSVRASCISKPPLGSMRRCEAYA